MRRRRTPFRIYPIMMSEIFSRLSGSRMPGLRMTQPRMGDSRPAGGGVSSAVLTGGGKLPPLPPRLPDGGDGGGGEGDGVGGQYQQLQRYRLGLIFATGSIAMLLVGMTTVYAGLRYAGFYDAGTRIFRTSRVKVVLPYRLLLANSGVLGLSCVLAELARRAARMEAILAPVSTIPGVKPERRLATVWAGGAWLLGALFLAGQVEAWRRMHLYGMALRGNPSGAFVLLMSGLHALHLLVGMTVMGYACMGRGPRESLERRRLALDTACWYWHVIGAVWLYVLAVLWLMN